MSDSGKKLSTFEFLFSLQKRTLLSTEKLVQIALTLSQQLLNSWLIFLSRSIMHAKIQIVFKLAEVWHCQFTAFLNPYDFMEILRKLCQICKITSCTGFACCSSNLLWLLLNFEWSSWKSNRMILSKRFCPNCVASIHHSTWAGGVLWRSTWCLRSLKAKPWGWGSTRLFYHFDEDFPIPPAHRCILTKTRPMKIPIDQSVCHGRHCAICSPFLEECAIFGEMCYLWRNGLMLSF